VSAAGDLARGVVMAGIDATAIDDRLPRVGGYLLFNRDDATIGEIRALTDELRERHGGNVLIAIDQEGGRVARLRRGVEAIPPMMALGATGDAGLARRAGEQIAFDLRRAGCTLDFAPVLDLALEPESVVMGNRCFGSDPHLVAMLGAAFGSGLRSGGVLPCYKHFPGHGATAVDSHDALPVIEAGAATLLARDLVPFAAVASDAPAMMSAHVLVTAFDSERPATFSRRIAGDLLRGELGFRGALVTDCLEMQAAARDSGAVDALAAGADLLVFSHDPERALAAVAAIEAAVEAGRVPLERLQEAYARVARLRDAGAMPIALGEFAPHPGIGREIGRRAVTTLRGVPHADPVAAIAVAFGGATALRREAPALDEVVAAGDPAPEETDAALARIERSGRRPLVLARGADRHPARAGAIARILDAYPDAVVVAFERAGAPVFTRARHLLLVYGDDAASIGGLADAIFSTGPS